MTNFQKIRAAIEAPILTAFNSQVPPIPVYFDNVNSVPPDPPNEYIRVNLVFGIMQTESITSLLSHPRGSLIIRCFTTKGGGPARCQELVEIAAEVILALGQTKRQASSVFIRTTSIMGPRFYESQSADLPHFMGKISTGWHAILPCST
jgi:hypothetical protein